MSLMRILNGTTITITMTTQKKKPTTQMIHNDNLENIDISEYVVTAMGRLPYTG